MKSSVKPFTSKFDIFYVFPVPVDPGFSTCLLLVNNNLNKYVFLVESDVGIIISWYANLGSTWNYEYMVYHGENY